MDSAALASVEIRPISPGDCGDAERLWANQFSPVSPRGQVIEKTADPESLDWMGFVASDGDEFAGFGLMAIVDDAADLFNLGPGAFGRSPEREAAFYLTCVHPAYRHQGIGTELGARRVAIASERGVGRVVGIAWGAGSRIYERCGFDRVGSVRDYYDHDPGDVYLYRRWL